MAFDGGQLAAADPALAWFGPPLPAEVSSIIAELARVQRYDTGDELLREGEESRTFAIVRSGRVALSVLVPERGAVTILTVEPGDIIGWSALTAPHRATSTATALEPVELLAFEGAALRGLLRSDCRLAMTVYPRLLQAVSRRLVATREQLLDLFAAQGETAW
ncbi:MAG TPA: cyclic nucleotide-binding domain-containing protein [Candidatus Limnocylindrales bacterium]|nr:cyclic nucleotide-binding domain-containing protein [Candidatus Limnocylindrales bacterium]